jgi:hypothetical protein
LAREQSGQNIKDFWTPAAIGMTAQAITASVAITDDVNAFVNIDRTTQPFNPFKLLKKNGPSLGIESARCLATGTGNPIPKEAVWQPHKKLRPVKDTWSKLENIASQ